MKATSVIAQAPPVPTPAVRPAAGADAASLSVIFAGTILRRGAPRLSANVLIQPFCAALLAGVIGGLAVRYDVSSSLRLVSVPAWCWCPRRMSSTARWTLSAAASVLESLA
jgi:hypothetical protein